MSWFSKWFEKKTLEPVEKKSEEDFTSLSFEVIESNSETKLVLDSSTSNAVLFHHSHVNIADNELYLKSPLDKDRFGVIEPLDLMKVKFQQADNQSSRKDIVRGICLHHIMMGSFKKNVDFLVSKESGVSAHYCEGRNAELTQMVNTSKKAWHAGVSQAFFDGAQRNDLNNSLIGIEIVNPGVLIKGENDLYYYNCGGVNTVWKGEKPVLTNIKYPNGNILSGYSVPYTDKQIEKLVALCKALVIKYPNICRDNIFTHYEIAQPLGRKNDPFGLDIDLIKDLIFDT